MSDAIIIPFPANDTMNELRIARNEAGQVEIGFDARLWLVAGKGVGFSFSYPPNGPLLSRSLVAAMLRHAAAQIDPAR